MPQLKGNGKRRAGNGHWFGIKKWRTKNQIWFNSAVFYQEGRRRNKYNSQWRQVMHQIFSISFSIFVGFDKQKKQRKRRKRRKKKTCSTALSNGTVAKDSSPIFGREIHGQTKKAEWEEGLVSWEGNLTTEECVRSKNAEDASALQRIREERERELWMWFLIFPFLLPISIYWIYSFHYCSSLRFSCAPSQKYSKTQGFNFSPLLHVFTLSHMPFFFN